MAFNHRVSLCDLRSDNILVAQQSRSGRPDATYSCPLPYGRGSVRPRGLRSRARQQAGTFRHKQLDGYRTAVEYFGRAYRLCERGCR